MFEKLYGSNVFLAMVDPDRPNSWSTGLGRKVIAKLHEDGFSVVVCTNPAHFILADGDAVDNVMNSIRHSIRIADARVEESQWQRHHTPLTLAHST